MSKTTVLAVVLLCVLESCVSPSRSTTDYQRKAANSAEAMVSVTESALLTAQLASAGKAPAAYVSLRMSESEDDAGWIVTSFTSVQPPNERADELRSELLPVLNEASALIANLRIHAYRGELDRLEDEAGPLEGLSRRLKEFEKRAET